MKGDEMNDDVIAGRTGYLAMTRHVLTTIISVGSDTGATTIGTKSRAWKDACAASWISTASHRMYPLSRSPQDRFLTEASLQRSRESTRAAPHAPLDKIPHLQLGFHPRTPLV